MKKNVFTTSYRILLPIILAIALLAPKKPGQIAILILFGLPSPTRACAPHGIIFGQKDAQIGNAANHCIESGSCNKAMKVFRSYPQTGRAA